LESVVPLTGCPAGFKMVIEVAISPIKILGKIRLAAELERL